LLKLESKDNFPGFMTSDIYKRYYLLKKKKFMGFQYVDQSKIRKPFLLFKTLVFTIGIF
jgi:hypothetical protein